jgi:multidrug efflux system outer membrane protein
MPGGCVALGLGCLTLLSGCAVGPDYQRPTVEAPGSFRNAPTAATSNSFADLPWWDVYRDATLKSLIHTALTNNLDVRIAATRVEQARAISAQAGSQFYPSVGYGGGVSRGRNEFLGTPNPNNGSTGDAALATLSAAWEIDLWGRIRRLNESARAQFLATEEARRGVMLSLVSDVALAYFELLELDLQLEIAQRTTVSFQETLRLFNERLQGGVASRLDVSRAEGALATIAARVPEVERQIAIKENQINVLLGRNPGPVARNTTLLQQSMPPEVPAGLPSALLERRPDIRAAEQSLRSANAQVGVSVAEFFREHVVHRRKRRRTAVSGRRVARPIPAVQSVLGASEAGIRAAGSGGLSGGFQRARFAG